MELGPHPATAALGFEEAADFSKEIAALQGGEAGAMDLGFGGVEIGAGEGADFDEGDPFRRALLREAAAAEEFVGARFAAE